MAQSMDIVLASKSEGLSLVFGSGLNPIWFDDLISQKMIDR